MVSGPQGMGRWNNVLSKAKTYQGHLRTYELKAFEFSENHDLQLQEMHNLDSKCVKITQGMNKA